jgi:divalent metal cation (Fe/Co/Zn/Cd) transporter
VEKIFNPQPVEFSLVTALVLVGSILVKFWLAAFNRRLGKHIDSRTFLATAADSRKDVISTTAVLAAGLVERFSGWQVDGFMGLAVALFILYSGAMLAKETISPLLGETASPQLRELIVGIVSSEPKVLGYHDLMVHDYGPGQRFASMHVEMDQKEDPLLCHELIDNLERRCLQEHNVHLVIHYDPVVTGDEEMDRLKAVVEQVLREMDSQISIHDFRMVRGTGHTNLIFDIALPAQWMPKQKQVKQALDAALAEREEGKLYTVVTFDLATLNQS